VRRIYVETSVWSHWFAEDSPEAQTETRRFLRKCRDPGSSVELLVGDIVLAELSRAPDGKDLLLRGLVGEFAPTVLFGSDEAEELAQAYVAHGAMPPRKIADALHAAYATVNHVDILASWNYRHLVNVARRQRIQAINSLLGYNTVLEIITPPEVFEDAGQ
jgi:predicted nucleic acid-binding protein